MRGELDNLGSALPGRSAWAIATTTLALIGLVGAVGRPAREFAATRTRHEAAVERASLELVERRALEAFERAAGPQRVALAADGARALFPHDPSALELRGVVHALARARGLEGARVTVGEPIETGVALGELAVARREVVVEGTGGADVPAALARDLRALGHPATVLHVELAREEGARFFVRVGLGLYGLFNLEGAMGAAHAASDVEDETKGGAR